MKKTLVLVSLVALVISASPLIAQSVPMEMQAKLILKIIEFDKNIERYGNPIVIGVTSDELFTIFNAQKSALTIKGKDFSVEKISTLADMAKCKVLYADHSWSSNYKAASAKAAESKMLMFCSDEDGVMSGGVAISFKVIDGKPKIIMSLANAKAQGSDFPANFLQLTVVIGGL